MEQRSTSLSTSDGNGYGNYTLQPKHKVFVSHSGAQKGFVDQLCMDLERCDRHPFLDKRRDCLPIGNEFPRLIFDGIEQCEVGVVVLSEEFFTSKRPMLELVAIANVKKRKPNFTIMPIFLNITFSQCHDVDKYKRWLSLWHTWAELDSRIDVKEWENAFGLFGPTNGLEYNHESGEVEFRNEIVEAICKLVPPGTRFEDSHVQGRSRLCKVAFAPFVFGSFSETEAKYFQSPPPPEKVLKEVSLLPFQFGDLIGFDELRVSDIPTASETPTSAPSWENGAAALPRLQIGSAEVPGRTPPDEAAVQGIDKAPAAETVGFEKDGNVKEHSEAGRDEQGQAQVQAGNDQRASPKQAPKSWASLVGVQPGFGDVGRNAGHVKSAPVPASKPVSNGSVRLQPRGLVNTGNSCFANATLQALLSCPPFLKLLASIKSRTIPQTGFPALAAFANFAGQFRAATEPEQKDQKPGPVDVGRPFAPTMFDDVLRSFSPDQPPRGRPRQEDAQEFLNYLMDRLHEELLRLEGRSVAGQNAVVDDDEWETVGPKNRSALTRTHMSIKSPLSEIFGGQLCSVVKAKGNKASATVQPFLVLHLDILPEAVQSLEDALKFFAAPESLEGYKAASSKASEVVSASKAIKIQTLPPVLIIHFMRFSYGAHGSGKLNKAVKYFNSLTIGRELLASSSGPAIEGRKYELVATVTHHGKEPSAGHYTADCRQTDGRWLRFDDAVVSVVPINRVLQEQVYVLFYKRVTH